MGLAVRQDLLGVSAQAQDASGGEVSAGPPDYDEEWMLPAGLVDYEEWLEESGHLDREWHGTDKMDTVEAYRKRHPETPPGMLRATVLALAELEAHCPAHLKEKAWPTS